MTYSKDYVNNVLRLYHNRIKLNLNIKKILELQDISRFSLYNWLNNNNNNNNNNGNSYYKKRKKRKNNKITPECERFVIEYVKVNKQFQM